MAVVPRLLEMFQEGLMVAVAKEALLKQKLIAWAFSVGRRKTDNTQTNEKPGPLLMCEAWLADRLVFSAILDALAWID